VQRVVPDPELRDQVGRLAARLAAAPRTALRWIKLGVYQSGHFDLEGMLDFEFEAQAACWNSAESGEGLRAFAERREPRFP
jgi:2-(1,2-epoxy-1,2-dihydrophenyl)acetyl-CoA isomerase